MALDLESVKLYCKIDFDADDDLVTEFIAAAQEYLEEAGVPASVPPTPLYSLAVKAMVLEMYDKRGLTAAQAAAAVPAMRNTITQLKLTAETSRIAEVMA